MISWQEQQGSREKRTGRLGVSPYLRGPERPGCEGRRSPVSSKSVVCWEPSHFPAVCLVAIRGKCRLSAQFRGEDMSQGEAG